MWGGCWCITFHLARRGGDRTADQNRQEKRELVRGGQAHAALLYEADDLVGSCRFGYPTELPARVTCYDRLGVAPPPSRITCFFVDRDHRKQGIAKAALAGALRMIADGGGGLVDGSPVSTGGKGTSGSFLWAGTETMFAQLEFRPLGTWGGLPRE